MGRPRSRDLAEEGLVQRVHGGALPASPAVGDYGKREQLSTEVKARLGVASPYQIVPAAELAVLEVDSSTDHASLEPYRALGPSIVLA
jgi:DeoR/GlpR family transcriptional regulator of sugar metabolism